MASTMTIAVTLVLATMTMCTSAQLQIQNRLADPTTLYQPINLDFEQICEVKGPPLDLMFVVDFSGSMREVYPRYLEIIKQVFNQIAVGPDAVRVAMVTFNSRSIIRFPFNAYNNKREYIAFLNQLIDSDRQATTSRYDLGFLDAYSLWDEKYGMRPDRAGVKRMMIVMGDGRSSHIGKVPVDVLNATAIRQDHNVDVYGVGLTVGKDTIADKIMRQYITGRSDLGFERYIVNGNETKSMDWFKPFEGVEICEEVPKCQPGAHAPVDMTFVLDLSGSVEDRESSAFNFVRRALNAVFMGPEATQVSLVTYSNTAQVKVGFTDKEATNRDAMLNKINEIERCFDLGGSCVSSGGSTNTHDGLRAAYNMYDVSNGHREVNSKNVTVKKLVIVVSDGKSTSHVSAKRAANRLIDLRGATIFGVALGEDNQQADLQQLADLAGNNRNNVFLAKQRVFSAAVSECNERNILTCLLDFERVMLGITDKGCPDLNITDASENTKPVIIQPFDMACSKEGAFVTLRFDEQFGGSVMVAGHESNPSCRVTGDDASNTVTMALRDGNCGLKEEAIGSSKVKKTIPLRIRFHQYVETKADTVIAISCEVTDPERHASLTKKPDPNDTNNVLDPNTIDPTLATCKYTITPQQNGPDGCEVLDAAVGATLNHTWSCAGLGPDHAIFVHDCVADADDGNTTILSLLNHGGCQTDKFLMTTPKYEHARGSARHKVSVLSYAFKFPSDTIVRYRCMISVCDYSKPFGGCQNVFKKLGPGRIDHFPNECIVHPNAATKEVSAEQLPPYETPPLKKGYDFTTSVRARRINMYVRESSNIEYEGKPSNNFCRLR